MSGGCANSGCLEPARHSDLAEQAVRAGAPERPRRHRRRLRRRRRHLVRAVDLDLEDARPCTVLQTGSRHPDIAHAPAPETRASGPGRARCSWSGPRAWSTTCRLPSPRPCTGIQPRLAPRRCECRSGPRACPGRPATTAGCSDRPRTSASLDRRRPRRRVHVRALRRRGRRRSSHSPGLPAPPGRGSLR